MKFEENWPRGFRKEVIQRCGQVDRQWTDRQVDNRWQVITTPYP